MQEEIQLGLSICTKITQWKGPSVTPWELLFTPLPFFEMYQFYVQVCEFGKSPGARVDGSREVVVIM